MSVMTATSASTNASRVLRRQHGHAVVAVGLEDGDAAGPAVAAAGRGGEHGRDLAGEVRVVVDEGDALVATPHVEAAGDPAEAGQRPRRGRERHADGIRHRDRAEGVAHVVQAPQRDDDLAQLGAVAVDDEAQCSLGGADVAGPGSERRRRCRR